MLARKVRLLNSIRLCFAVTPMEIWFVFNTSRLRNLHEHVALLEAKPLNGCKDSMDGQKALLPKSRVLISYT